MIRAILLVLTIMISAIPGIADWKLTQKTKMGGADEMGRTTTVYQKGVRQRREEKIDMGAEANDPEVTAMMAQMGMSLPTFPTHITQCDLKRDLFVNEKNKLFFIDYYDWSSLPPETLQRRAKQKVVIKGTATFDTVITDSGKRKQMFGLTARWLKVVQTIETSADSCDGASSIKTEQEGWFVTLTLESESCPVRRPAQQSSPVDTGGCRPRMITKGTGDPGFLLTGTMKTYEGAKVAAVFEIETLELSRATLDPGLFDVPKGFVEVDSRADLDKRR